METMDFAPQIHHMFWETQVVLAQEGQLDLQLSITCLVVEVGVVPVQMANMLFQATVEQVEVEQAPLTSTGPYFHLSLSGEVCTLQ
jgi:hypothetical protein